MTTTATITPWAPGTDLTVPGVYSGVPELTYHQLSKAADGRTVCSSSRLRKALEVSFYAAKWELDHVAPAVLATWQMRLGSALHIAVLEPATWEDRVVGFEGFRKKADRDEAIALVKRGGVPLTFDHHHRVEHLAWTGFKGCPKAFTKAVDALDHRELTIIREVEGVLCKHRLDGVSTRLRLVADLKTGKVLDHEDRQKKLDGLDMQAAMYWDACAEFLFEPEQFVFLGLTQEMPIEGSVDTIDPIVIETGRRRYRRALAEWCKCENVGHWPKRNETIGELTYLPWQLRRIEEELSR